MGGFLFGIALLRYLCIIIDISYLLDSSELYACSGLSERVPLGMYACLELLSNSSATVIFNIIFYYIFEQLILMQMLTHSA